MYCSALTIAKSPAEQLVRMKLAWLGIDFIYMWFMTVFATVYIFRDEAQECRGNPEIEIVYTYLFIVEVIFGWIACAFYTLLVCCFACVCTCMPK